MVASVDTVEVAADGTPSQSPSPPSQCGMGGGGKRRKSKRSKAKRSKPKRSKAKRSKSKRSKSKKSRKGCK